jgi:hypothetical protein
MISSRYVTEIGYLSFNHVGEELCGDHIEVTSKDESTKILVLADGLGSGVKANILSTLTSKMLSSMIAGDISIKECIRCIANTLPVCKVRKVAYSTFTIIKIKDNKYVDIYNFDNPTPFLIHDGKVMELSYSSTVIDNKTIYHAKYEASLYDTFILMSDGVKYAGVGETLNFGWDMPQIKDYMNIIYQKEYSAKALATELANQCNELYNFRPGDDTTVAVVRIRERKQVNLLIGPATNKDDDEKMLSLFFAKEGVHIVSGGTTGKITARYLGKNMILNDDYLDKEVPPTSYIEGVDLVTEGIITINKVLQYANNYLDNNSEYKTWLFKQDGASAIAQYLFEQATDINFFVGCAMNIAHQGEESGINFATKMHLIDDLASKLKKMGKNVRVSYF